MVHFIYVYLIRVFSKTGWFNIRFVFSSKRNMCYRMLVFC